MILEKPESLRRSDCSQRALDVLADQEPNGTRIELLRSLCDPGLKLRGDTHQCRPRLVEMRMQSGERNGGLPRVFGSASDGGHEPRA